jgi:ParB-like chromosome segregation protein Spo0J
MNSRITEMARELAAAIAALPEGDRIDALNESRIELHRVSPLRHHPIDLVLWVSADGVRANGYNPNTVAPPEMRLLEHSIASDGYTQPVVTWLDGGERETVDGYHRGRVGRESAQVRTSTGGRLPVTTLGADRTSIDDRMAATIRHNRARGVHGVDAMSAIVRDLVRRNRSDSWIAKELGMEPDEVLRLKQITGIADLFASREFSEAWEPE